jgi:type I restriction enzyme S subunit
MVASCKQNELDNFSLKEGQVAITKDSETRDDIGVSTYISESFEDVVLGYHTSLITPDPKLLSGKYLHYWFNTKQAKVYFENNAGGSGQRCTLPIDIIKAIPLHLPPIDLQEQIATLFYNIDSKIELNNRINDELEAMAKTLYDYWFVQFDFPNSKGKPYRTSGGKMVWNVELKREIPEGWKDGTFADYCPSTGGFAFKSNWWTDEGVAVAKIKDIQENYTLDTSDLTRVDISDKEIDNKFLAKAGDVLIAMTGATVGKYAIMPITDYPIYVNQRVGYFSLGNDPTKRLPFLINSMNQSYFRNAIFTLANGAAQPNISNEQINSIQLLMPDKKLINTYNEMFHSHYKKILNNQLENQKLTDLRDWLLPMLMNGQVKVMDENDMQSSINTESKKEI